MNRGTIIHLRASALHRLTAWAALAVVVLLCWFAASPVLHGWLHERHGAVAHTHAGHDQAPCPDEAGCFVTQFALGQVPLVGAPVVLEAPALLSEFGQVRPPSLRLTGSRHFLPPGHGPPAS